MLSGVVLDSTIRMHLDSLLVYRTAKVHARGSSISMWQSSWFNQHKISLSVNQSPTPKGVVSLAMVLRVRLLEVGGSTWGALGKAFFPFTFFCGTGGGGGSKAFFPFTFFCGKGGGAHGNAFSPFSFCCGTKAVGGGTKRSTSESDDRSSFFFISLPGGEAKRGLERTSNSSSVDKGSLGGGGWRSKPPQRLPPNANY